MPVFTSTTVSTLWRKVASAARHVPRTQGAVLISGRRARLAFRRILHETFPSLATPGHLLRGQVRLEPIRLGTRAFKPLSPHARLHQAAGTFRRAFTVPAAGRGGRMVANVGIGQGAAINRTFATAPGGGGTMFANAPTTLRAFAQLLSDDEVEKRLPRGTECRAYIPKRRVRRVAKNRSFSQQSFSSRLSDVRRYLPLPAVSGRSPDNEKVQLPITIETLITPSQTTVLSLPLHPSFELLEVSTARIPYYDASIGITTFASLTAGALDIESILSLPCSQRILALMARLENLGFFGELTAMGGISHEVVPDQHGYPEMLRLYFWDRSEADVRALLGDVMADHGTNGVVWYGIKQLRTGEAETALYKLKEDEAVVAELRDGERREIQEIWDTPSEPIIPTHRAVELDQKVAAVVVDTDWQIPDVEQDMGVSLVYPNPNASFASSTMGMEASEWADQVSPASPNILTPVSPTPYSTGLTSMFSPGSSTSSGSPFSLGSPGSPGSSLMSSSTLDASAALAAHLEASNISDYSASIPHMPQADSEHWAISPSDDDAKVESAVGLMSSFTGSNS